MGSPFLRFRRRWVIKGMSLKDEVDDGEGLHHALTRRLTHGNLRVSLMGLSFPKLSQEPAMHYDIIARLKNGDSKPNLEARFLISKIYRKFGRVLFVNRT